MNRILALLSIITLQVGCSQPKARPAASPAPVVAPAEPAEPSTAPATAPSSFWLQVLKHETTWTLFDDFADEGDTPDHVEVALTKRRVIGEVVIAELSWTEVSGTSRNDLVTGVPGLIAADGVRVLVVGAGADREGETDAAILKSLRETPTFTESDTDYETADEDFSEYRSSKQTTMGTMICFGEGPPDDPDFECNDTCYAEVCFSDRNGAVKLNGTWAPSYSHYSADGYKDIN